jgi:hypothetical protein
MDLCRCLLTYVRTIHAEAVRIVVFEAVVVMHLPECHRPDAAHYYLQRARSSARVLVIRE